MADSLLTDAQYGGLIAAIVAGLGGIAAAVRWGLGRGAKAFDDMAVAFKALADRHQSTQEGRDDIAEIKTTIVAALATETAPKKRRTAPHPAMPAGGRRANTDSDR